MTPTERFLQLVAAPEAEVALDEAALLIAAHAHPTLDVAAELAHLDELAAGVPADLDAVRRRLFVDEGFCGNRTDYYDPENSYLDSVLARKTGIPITLSVVLLEVARRCGIELVGIGMPGHFLVATTGPAPTSFVDAFDGGELLDQSGCAARFAALSGGRPLDPAALAPVGPIDILARMLANLGGVARQRRDPALLQWVLRLRAGMPARSLPERREVAAALARSGRFGEAADVLEQVADAMDAGPDHDVRRAARALRARLN